MKKLVLAFAIILSGISAFGQNTDVILSSYYAVKNALVKGNSKDASAAISELQQTLRSESAFGLKDDLTSIVDKLAKANNIDKQRASFNDLSKIMWKLIEGADIPDQPVYYQYCPMKRSYWLSNEKAIKNPYYGASMLTCGKVVDIKE